MLMDHFTRKIIFLFLFILSAKVVSAQWTIYNSSNTGGIQIDAVTSLKINSLGKIWIGSLDQGVSYYDGTAWTSYDNTTTGFPNVYIKSIYTSGSQTIASTGFNGVGKFASGTWTTTNSSNGLVNDDVRGVFPDPGLHLWYATDGGLSVDSITQWRSFTTSNSPGMPTNHLTCVYVDHQNNNKWVGTFGAGLLKLTTTSNIYTWTKYNTTTSSIPSNNINKIATSSDNKLYVCTDAGLAIFDGSAAWTIYNHANSDGAITNDTIQDIAIDDQGNMYLATPDGLVLKTSATNIWTRYHSGNTNLPENKITAVDINSTSGDIWVGTSASGAAKNNRSNLLSTADAIINAENVGLFPNPTEGEIHIVLDILSSSEEIHFILSDITGKEITHEVERKINPGIYNKTFTLAGAPAGIYLLKINTSGQALTKRIIKY